MANTPEAAATPQMSIEDAQLLLQKRASIDPFFARLAEHGIVPNTDADVAGLLQLGDQLLQQHQQTVTKQANAVSPLLQRALNKFAATAQVLQNDDPQTWERITQSLLRDPSVAEAAFAVMVPYSQATKLVAQ